MHKMLNLCTPIVTKTTNLSLGMRKAYSAHPQ